MEEQLLSWSPSILPDSYLLNLLTLCEYAEVLLKVSGVCLTAYWLKSYFKCLSKVDSMQQELDNLKERSKQDLQKILRAAKTVKENLSHDEQKNSLVVDKLDEIIRIASDTTARQKKLSLIQRLQNAFSGKETLAVQLLFTNQMSQNVCNNLLVCLKNLARKPTDFRIHNIESDIDESKPLLVVCLSLSRLESDINKELSQLKITCDMRQKTLVLILHLGTESSLPRLPTSTRVGSSYADITIIDLAYNQELYNLYNCEMNETAKDPFNEFLEKFRH